MGRILTTLALAVVSSVLLTGAELTTPPASGQGPQQPAAPNLPLTIGQPPAASQPVTPPASDQGQQPAAPQPVVEDIRAKGRPIVLQVSEGTLLRLPRVPATVFVADSDVADATVQQTEFILLSAKKPGATVLYAVDNAGDMLMQRFVEVRGGPVTIIRGVSIGTAAPAPGPLVLQLATAPAAAPAAAPAPR